MKTIHLIPEHCIACGLCQVIAPEIFDYYDNGLVKFFSSPSNQRLFAKKDTKQVTLATRRCPAQAIRVDSSEVNRENSAHS